MANVTYWGKGIKFSTYKNGSTPFIGENGNWWINGEDTGYKAQGEDGISFSGVTEFYYATLATDIDEKTGEPIPPEEYPIDSKTEDLEGWFTSIQGTSYGQKDGEGITYKYLWNVEKIITTGPKAKDIYTSPNLLQIYDGGRIPADYISYYAGNTTNQAPANQPAIDSDNGNYIYFKNGENNVILENEKGESEVIAPGLTPWDRNGITADANNYLFEITFVRYAEKDENGKNLYAEIEGPTLIGRNGADALNLTLNNDSDVVAITESGQVIKRKVGNTGEMITKVEASLTSNGVAYEGEISLTPPGTEWEDHYRSGFEDDGTRWLIIDSLPKDFTEGDFVFGYNNLKRSFHLSTKKSEVDYNLSLDRTLINSSETGGEIKVTVKKIDAAGKVTNLTNAEDAKKDNIYLYTGPNETDANLNNDWQVSFNKGNTNPIYFDIREEHETNGKKSSFTWDHENVEFIKNGELIGRYTLSLDNDFDIVVKQPDETWLSTDDIVVTATGYDGRQLQENIRVKITPYGTIPGEEGNTKKINWSGICEGLETNGTIISNKLTIHPSKLPITFQEATFTFEWLLDDQSPDGDYIPLDTKKFTLKAITSIADYDLVVPQTVYNASSNDQSVNVWIRKKSDGKTETISEYKETLPVQIYLKTITEGTDRASTTAGYELQKKWDIDISDRVKKHLILCNAAVDKDNKLIEKPTAEQLGFVWDEEIIEFVKDGSNGQNIYILYHDADAGEDGTLQSPTEKDYDKYSVTKDGSYNNWYRIETKNSVFRVSKICLPEVQAITPWGSVVSNQGTEGPASCSLSLSSDSDTIVKNNAGEWISTETIEVTAEAFIGADLQVEESKDEENLSVPITLMPPSDDWKENEHYTYDSLKKTLSIDPQKIPDDFTSGEFTFKWEIQSGDTITKKFSLKVTTGLVDYDLIVPQTVYNKDNYGTEINVPVYVLEKSQNGTKVVDYSTDLTIAIYKKNGEKYEDCGNWTTNGIPLNTEKEDGMHLVLGNKPIPEEPPKEEAEPMSENLEEGEIVEEEKEEPSFIWDEEIIELVSNGLPAEMPFTISLVPDYISVPCDSLANVVDNFKFPEIEPTIYHGQDVWDDWNTPDNSITPTPGEYYLTVEGDGIDVAWNNKKVSLSNMTGQAIEITQGKTTETIYTDTALVTFKFYRYEENDGKMVGELKGSAVTEVVKKLGSLGAIRCYIESNLGTMFEEGQDGDTILTARIFEGSIEIDSDGENYIYNWKYQEGEVEKDLSVTPVEEKSTKKVVVSISELKNKEVWFTTSPKSNSQTT